MNKMISVIVPVYNTKIEFLRRCISSIMKQSYRNFEVILVLNGCNETYEKEVVSDFQTIDVIRVINIDEKGVSNARNCGLGLAQGEYIVFVDADDELVLSYFERAVNLLEDNQCDIVSGGIKFQYNDCANDMVYSEEGLKIYSPEDIGNHLLGWKISCNEELRNYHFSSPCAKIYRKSVLQNVSFDNNLYHREDLLFNYNVVPRCKRIGVINEIWYVYYQYEGSAIHSFGRKIIENNICLLKGIIDSDKQRIIYANDDMHYKSLLFFFSILISEIAINCPDSSEWKLAYTKILLLLKSTDVLVACHSNIVKQLSFGIRLKWFLLTKEQKILFFCFVRFVNHVRNNRKELIKNK